MITEDYVSFETAKLLKGKGFDFNSCSTYYTLHGEVCEIGKSQEIGIAPHPTIQMVMKWLMEEHNLFIVIDRHYFVVDRISNIASGFKYFIKIKTINTVYTHNNYKSYEEAYESAINYCLENLI